MTQRFSLSVSVILHQASVSLISFYPVALYGLYLGGPPLSSRNSVEVNSNDNGKGYSSMGSIPPSLGTSTAVEVLLMPTSD